MCFGRMDETDKYLYPLVGDDGIVEDGAAIADSVLWDHVTVGAEAELKAAVADVEAALTDPERFPAFMPHLKDVFTPALVPVLFAFLLTDFFDTMGTVTGVAAEFVGLQPARPPRHHPPRGHLDRKPRRGQQQFHRPGVDHVVGPLAV